MGASFSKRDSDWPETRLNRINPFEVRKAAGESDSRSSAAVIGPGPLLTRRIIYYFLSPL